MSIMPHTGSEDGDSSVSSLPSHLAHCHRAPLLVDPEVCVSIVCVLY